MSGFFLLNPCQLERVLNRKKFFLKNCDQFKYVKVGVEYGDLTEKWSARGKWKNDLSDVRSTIKSLATRKFIDESNITDWSWSWNYKGSFSLEMGDASLEGALEGYPKSRI